MADRSFQPALSRAARLEAPRLAGRAAVAAAATASLPSADATPLQWTVGFCNCCAAPNGCGGCCRAYFCSVCLLDELIAKLPFEANPEARLLLFPVAYSGSLRASCAGLPQQECRQCAGHGVAGHRAGHCTSNSDWNL